MPNVDKHCKISSKRSRNETDYRELHEWIDSSAKDLGYNHRLERHSDNEAYRRFIKKKWGERAVVEWLFHIAIDNLQTAYKESKKVYGKKTYNYYQFALSDNDMFFECDKLTNVELLKKFDGNK